MHFFVMVNLSAQIIEYIMLFMHKEEALSKPAMDKITMIRRIVTILSEIICVLLLVLIYNSSHDKIVEYLIANPCSDD